MTIKEGVTEYIQSLREVGRSKSTLTAYENDLDQFINSIKELKNDTSLTEITSKNIKDFVDLLSEKKNFTPKTISRKLNSVKSLFKYLYSKKYILTDPSRPIPHPKLKSNEPNILSQTEYRSLRDSARDNSRTYAIVELLIQTGMRIGELSRIKLSNLQLDSNPPQILIEQRGNTPMRIIELNEKAKETIINYLPERVESENDKGFLFNTKSGNNMNIRNIRAAIDKCFEKAGITDVTVNDIRNTFITHQLKAGVSLAKVAQMVGHKRFASTEKFLELIDRNESGHKEKLEVL